MCGILGYIGRRSFDAEAFGRALDLMAARGPDDRGVYEEPEVLLGHRRLAIIDLSPGGHQPMELRSASFQRDRSPLGRYGVPAPTFDSGATGFLSQAADGRYLIVFNGEIYNYQALRRDLEKADS